jgi:hypothetical protein
MNRTQHLIALAALLTISFPLLQGAAEPIKQDKLLIVRRRQSTTVLPSLAQDINKLEGLPAFRAIEADEPFEKSEIKALVYILAPSTRRLAEKPAELGQNIKAEIQKRYPGYSSLPTGVIILLYGDSATADRFADITKIGTMPVFDMPYTSKGLVTRLKNFNIDFDAFKVWLQGIFGGSGVSIPRLPKLSPLLSIDISQLTEQDLRSFMHKLTSKQREKVLDELLKM